MAKILETNLCRINYSDSLEELSNATVKLLQNKIVEYKKLFNIEFDEQIIVNYFDDLEEFREFIYKIRGERVSLPKYAKGTYDDGMVNACIEPDTQLKRLYTASHELFHILYMKYILKNDYSNRMVIEFGKKYNERTLRRIRQYYRIFKNEKWSPLATKLTWSHYCELLSIKDINEISYYINISEEQNLSKRQLREKIKSKEYQR